MYLTVLFGLLQHGAARGAAPVHAGKTLFGFPGFVFSEDARAEKIHAAVFIHAQGDFGTAAGTIHGADLLINLFCHSP
jgi:hypothetical protein